MIYSCHQLIYLLTGTTVCIFCIFIKGMRSLMLFALLMILKVTATKIEEWMREGLANKHYFILLIQLHGNCIQSAPTPNKNVNKSISKPHDIVFFKEDNLLRCCSMVDSATPMGMPLGFVMASLRSGPLIQLTALVNQ